MFPVPSDCAGCSIIPVHLKSRIETTLLQTILVKLGKRGSDSTQVNIIQSMNQFMECFMFSFSDTLCFNSFKTIL